MKFHKVKGIAAFCKNKLRLQARQKTQHIDKYDKNLFSVTIFCHGVNLFPVTRNKIFYLKNVYLHTPPPSFKKVGNFSFQPKKRVTGRQNQKTPVMLFTVISLSARYAAHGAIRLHRRQLKG
jgi:hypothetical protein